jgi:hypothetical protein
MIDVNTGLPELPDGQRWVIRECGTWDEFYGWRPDDELEIALQKVEIIAVFAKKRKHIFSRTWIDDRSKIVEHKERRTTLYTEKLLGAHPIAAVNAANRILKRVAKDKMRNDLIGTYPPKRLGNEGAS